MSKFLLDVCKLYNSINLRDIIPDVDELIYHYTSPLGFKGILEYKTLRFSDRYFLNDYSEGIYVMELCLNNIDSIVLERGEFKDKLLDGCKERIENPQNNNFFGYQCSFSLNKDSLCLWNYYTKGDNIQGYSLGFNSKELCSKLKLTSITEDGNIPVIVGGKVVYDESQQLSMVNEIVNRFFDLSRSYNDKQIIIDLLIDKLMLIGAFFKKEYFKVEEEYRLVVDLHINSSTRQFSLIKEEQNFYEKNGILIPYIDIAYEPGALKEIRLSPTLDVKTAVNSIYRTTMRDFPQIEKYKAVKQSEIPVRY